MADHHAYQKAMYGLFFEGKTEDSDTVEMIDPKTKKVIKVPRSSARSTTPPDVNKPIPDAAMRQLQEMKERARRRREELAE